MSNTSDAFLVRLGQMRERQRKTRTTRVEHPKCACADGHQAGSGTTLWGSSNLARFRQGVRLATAYLHQGAKMRTLPQSVIRGWNTRTAVTIKEARLS
jgi:hypothetical protein